MSVVAISEIWQGRAGDDDISGERKYSRVFRVTTNSNYDEAAVVKSNGSLPQLGSQYPYDLQAFCQNVAASQEALSPRIWNVVASYSNKREVSDDPMQDEVEFEWATEQFQRPAFLDKDGNGIVNSAGDPYIPAVERDDSRPVVTITRNLETVPAWIMDYQDAVNSSAVNIDGISIAARCAKMQSVTVGKRQQRGTTSYRTVTMAIHLNRDTWDFEIMDAGYRAKDGTDRVIITNDDGTEISAPVPLNGSGGKLSNPTDSTIVFNNHRVYEELDFNALPLT